MFAEPFERDPSAAPIVKRELDAKGNDPRSDASGWVTLAEQLEPAHQRVTVAVIGAPC